MSAARPRGRRLLRRAGIAVALAAALLVAALIVGPAVMPPAGLSDTRAPQRSGPVEDPAGPPTAAAEAGLSVSGNRLLRDGRPYVPRGFNMIGLLTPEWCDRPTGIQARAHFGQAELDAAADWRADTLRFQVSQRGLADRTVPQAERAAYLARVVAGVQLARSNGFVVIVSMQDQRYGCGSIHPLPSSETVDAWSVVAPPFLADPYVMFELFNEPQNENDAAGWAQWRDGGSGPDANLGAPAVGHQTLVDHLRTLGSRNVLIADTARLAKRTTGMPLLADPTGNLAYAIHPYTFDSERSWWDLHFGDLAARVPVVATEWNYLGEDCGSEKEHRAAEFLEYLRQHSIGVLGHAFDAPGTLVADWTWAPTACGTAAGGSGEVLRAWFAELAEA